MLSSWLFLTWQPTQVLCAMLLRPEAFVAKFARALNPDCASWVAISSMGCLTMAGLWNLSGLYPSRGHDPRAPSLSDCANGPQVIEQFGMFIFDEVHLIGESGRGWTLEQDLAYLHYFTRSQSHRIILISAAIGNRNHFVQWLNEDGRETLQLHSDWRGPAGSTPSGQPSPIGIHLKCPNCPSVRSFPTKQSTLCTEGLTL